ncbi:MAG TPA: hypothetical protein PK098_10720 [Phycisphaerales bacterium]|nr:hypothetical protein [Phycisphaerales bacterium]
MLHLICPIVYGLTIAWILVRVNPSATLYIVPLFILLLPFLHRFNSRVRQQSRDYYTNATRNQAEFISVVLRQAGAQNIHQDHHRRAIQELFRNSVEIRRFHDSYDHFRLASDRSILITSLFRPVALGFVIAVLGAQALHGHVLWGEIIVYAVALGQLIAHIQTVTTQFTKLNLYYPEVAKYLDFRASQPRSITPAQPVERINLIVLNAPPVGSSPSEPLSLKRGDRAMLVCDLELNRTHLQMIVEPLKRATRHNKGRAAWDRAGFLAESPVVLPLTLAQFILGERSGEEAARRPLIEALDRLGVRDEVNTTLGGLDCVMEPAVWKAMSGTCRAVIRLLSAAADSQEVVIVDWRILSRVDVARLGDVLGILEDRVVLISTTDVKAIVPTQFVSTVLILQGSSFVAAGDAAWWTASGLRHRLINARFLPTEQSNLVEPDEDMQM